MSSLHDGMNLVAKEFVAARDDEQGVLVLSQFTGAARDLTEALIVNPYDLGQASDALAAALRMPPDEQRERMRSMRRLVSEFNVYRWAGRMLVDAAELRRKERITGRLSSMLHAAPGDDDEAPPLAREPRAARRSWRWSNVLLAFDFDGTLAPIVADRHEAAMRARTAQLFATVCELLPVRGHLGAGQADVARRLRRRRGSRTVIGNHGARAGTRLADVRAPGGRRRIRCSQRRARGVAGIDIENKRYSLAVHYRRAREQAAGPRGDRGAPSPRLPVAMRIIPGKLVINVVPEAAPEQGRRAARAARSDARPTSPCTSATTSPTRTSSASISRAACSPCASARSRTSAARYYLRQQQEIDALLEHLVALRVDATAGWGAAAERVRDRPRRAPIRVRGSLEFLECLWRTSHALERRSRRMEKAIGVTAPQRLVLRFLGRFPGVTAGHLARALHIDPGTLSASVSRLEARGLVERRRDPIDTRRVTLGLTREGRALDVPRPGTVEAAADALLADASPGTWPPPSASSITSPSSCSPTMPRRSPTLARSCRAAQGTAGWARLARRFSSPMARPYSE